MSYNFRNIIILILFGFMLTVPVLILRSHDDFRLDTDYNAALPAAYFVKLAYTHPIPYMIRNPFVAEGISVRGDPSTVVFSPYYIVPFVLFSAETGMKIIITLTVVASGIAMYALLTSLNIRPSLSLWAGMLYASSGGLAAYIASARLERFASYATIPIVFLYFFKRRMRISHIFAVSFVIAAMIYSGDFYVPWLLGVLLVSLQIGKWAIIGMPLLPLLRDSAMVVIGVVVLIAPKIYFFVTEVLPVFDRAGFIGGVFSAGSVHLPYVLLSYGMPLQVSFYDRPFFQRTLGFYYNWYEYYAFITPLPLVFLGYIRRVWQHPIVRVLTLVLVIGGLYVSMAYVYSPFYWLFRVIPVLQTFRVPQRMVVPILVPLILLICFIIQEVYRKLGVVHRRLIGGLLVITIVWTSFIFIRTLNGTFESPRIREQEVVRAIRARDSGTYFVASFVCCIQPYLVESEIPTLNFYYGWLPKDTPRFAVAGKPGYRYEELTGVKPKYLITPAADDFTMYGYDRIIDGGSIHVWETSEPTTQPHL